jgi:hypothetical protein
MSMKKAFGTFGFLLMCLTTFAQRDATAEQRAQMRTAQLTKNLELTKEQESKIYELYLNQIKNMEKDRQQDREKFRADREEQQAKLEKILTDDQREKLKAMRMEERKKREEARSDERPQRAPRKQRSQRPQE